MLAQSIMLAAQEHGLDTAPVFMSAIYPDLIRAELNVPDDLSIFVGILLGYGGREHLRIQYRTKRRPLQKMARLSGFEPN